MWVGARGSLRSRHARPPDGNQGRGEESQGVLGRGSPLHIRTPRGCRNGCSGHRQEPSHGNRDSMTGTQGEWRQGHRAYSCAAERLLHGPDFALVPVPTRIVRPRDGQSVVLSVLFRRLKYQGATDRAMRDRLAPGNRFSRCKRPLQRHRVAKPRPELEGGSIGWGKGAFGIHIRTSQTTRAGEVSCGRHVLSHGAVYSYLRAFSIRKAGDGLDNSYRACDRSTTAD